MENKNHENAIAIVNDIARDIQREFVCALHLLNGCHEALSVICPGLIQMNDVQQKQQLKKKVGVYQWQKLCTHIAKSTLADFVDFIYVHADTFMFLCSCCRRLYMCACVCVCV